MIPFVPSREKHEINTVYLDFGDAKTRNSGSRNRSRRFSVSFDGRTPVSNAGDDKFYTVHRAQKTIDSPSPASQVDSLPKGFDFSTRLTQSDTSPGNYWNQIGGNVMTSSLIEEKSRHSSSPVNRELAVELLKEYVKSLKDFSSLLKLRQHQETKDTSTSPISTPASDKENAASAPTFLPIWTPQSTDNKKQLNDFSSGDLHNKSSQSIFSRPSKSVSSDHYLPPARSAFSQNCSSSSDSAMLNDMKKTECLSAALKNETSPTAQHDLPNKFILRKFFQRANQPSVQISSALSPSRVGVKESPPFTNAESDLSMSRGSATTMEERNQLGTSERNRFPGSMRSEAAFHRQYTQLLWPSDIPLDADTANLHKASLEFKTPEQTEERSASSDAEIAFITDQKSITSPTGMPDSISLIKSRSATLQPGGFRRGGSVSPSVRPGQANIRPGMGSQFGRYLTNAPVTARVLISPPVPSPHSASASVGGADTRRSFRPFTSAFESSLTNAGPGSVGDKTSTPISPVHHHRVVKNGLHEPNGLEKSVMASPLTLSASAELGLPDRLVREIPPPSPSSQSSRSGSFDSFSTRVGSVDNRIGSSLSPSSFGDVCERETFGATVQTPLFRRNLSDSGPAIRPYTRIFDSRRNTLAAPIHPFTTSASLPAGSESPKPISSYTRSTTTPVFNSTQKPSTVNRDHHPNAWTTISRREELKQPLDIKVDDPGKWKSNGYTSLSTQKADMGTQTELSPDWILSPDAERGSCESLPSDLLPGGPVLQTWPLSLQSVVRPTDVDSEVERANLNGLNASGADVNSFVDEDSRTERTETSGSPTPVPSPTSVVQTNRSAFSRPLMRRHSMKGALSERPITLSLGEQPNLQSHRLSLSRPFRSTLSSPIYGTGTTEAPRCRSVHFSSDVLVAHTGSGPEPLLLSSAPLKEPAPCEVNEDRGRSKPISKPFIIGPRRFSSSGRQQPTETNFHELQISVNQNQPQPRLPRPTPFRRNLVPRGSSEPNL